MSYDFLTFIALIVSVIAGFFAIIKFHSDLKKEIYDFKIEVSNRLSKIENKLDITEVNHNSTNQRIDKLEIDFKEQRTEFKDFINRFIESISKKPIL